MNKLEILQGLRQTIEELKEKRSTLSAELDSVRQAMTADHFLSAELCNTMKHHLEGVLELEQKCETTYEQLEQETLPDTFSEMNLLFEKKQLVYQEQSYYGVAVDFFLSLYSEDKNTQELLELHQAVLRDIDRKNPLSEEEKKMLEEYVQFVAAYQETDGVKLIGYSQKLAKTFENQLISGAVFKQGLHQKTSETQQENENPQVQTQKEVKKRIETEMPEMVIENSKNVSEEELLPEEPDIKKKIMFVPYRALKVEDPLNVKEFKRDLSGESVEIRKLILNKAYQYGGITLEILENLTAAPISKLSEECDFLYNKGYLYRYELKEKGIFYGLTERGGQAFSIENTAVFLGIKKQAEQRFSMLTEETEARVIYLLLKTIDRLQKKIELMELNVLPHTLKNCFFLEIVQRENEKHFVYTGWIPKKEETIESYVVELKQILETENCQGVVIVDEDSKNAEVLKHRLEDATGIVFQQEENGNEVVDIPQMTRVEDEKEKKQLRSALLQEAGNRALNIFWGNEKEADEPISRQELEEAGIKEMSQEDMDALLADAETL